MLRLCRSSSWLKLFVWIHNTSAGTAGIILNTEIWYWANNKSDQSPFCLTEQSGVSSWSLFTTDYWTVRLLIQSSIGSSCSYDKMEFENSERWFCMRSEQIVRMLYEVLKCCTTNWSGFGIGTLSFLFPLVLSQLTIVSSHSMCLIITLEFLTFHHYVYW